MQAAFGGAGQAPQKRGGEHMIRQLMAAVAIAAAMAGCVPVEKAEFGQMAGQTVVVRDGRQAVLSRGRATELIVAPASRVQGDFRPAYVAMIRNMSGAPITFMYSDITVTQVEDGKPLKVWTVDQLQSEARGNAIVGAILLGAAGAAGGYYAGSGQVNGYRYTYSGYNSGVGAALASRNVNQVTQQAQANIANLENNMLKDNTIMPGEVYGGRFVFDGAKVKSRTDPKHYRISFKIGPDSHVIDLTTQLEFQK